MGVFRQPDGTYIYQDSSTNEWKPSTVMENNGRAMAWDGNTFVDVGEADPAPVAPKEVDDSLGNNLWQLAKRGVGGAGVSAGYEARAFTDDSYGQSLQNAGQGMVDEANANLSERAKKVAEASFFEKDKDGAWHVGDGFAPESLLYKGAEMSAPLLAMVGTALGVGAAAVAAGAAAPVAGITAGVGGGLAAALAFSGLDGKTVEDTVRDIADKNPEKFWASPEAQAALAETGGDREKAVQVAAFDAGQKVAAASSLINVGFGALAGPLAGQAAKGAVLGVARANAAPRALAEGAALGFGQTYATTEARNQQTDKFDEDRHEDPVLAGANMAVVGGGIGAGLGALGGSKSKQQAARERDGMLYDALTKVVGDRTVAADGAMGSVAKHTPFKAEDFAAAAGLSAEEAAAALRSRPDVVENADGTFTATQDFGKDYGLGKTEAEGTGRTVKDDGGAAADYMNGYREPPAPTEFPNLGMEKVKPGSYSPPGRTHLTPPPKAPLDPQTPPPAAPTEFPNLGLPKNKGWKYSASGMREDGSPAGAGTTPTSEQARALIEKRLEEMRRRGDVGLSAVQSVEEAMKSGRSAEEVYAAFLAADAASHVAPKHAGIGFRFLNELLTTPEAKASGAAAVGEQAEARTVPLTDGGPLRALIEFSLHPEVRDKAGMSGAHEAYHVLRNYILQYDKSAPAILARAFPEGGGLRNIGKTMERALKTLSRDGKQSYWDLFDEHGLLDNPHLTAEEKEAYTLGAIAEARRAGFKVPGMEGAILRTVNTFAKIADRVKNYAQRDNMADRLGSFRTAEDIFSKAADGGYREAFNGRPQLDITDPHFSSFGEKKAPPLTSALIRAVETLPDERLTGAQWAAKLYQPASEGYRVLRDENNKVRIDPETGQKVTEKYTIAGKPLLQGVKEDELRWTGVLDHLAQQGDQAIAKKDLLNYLRKNDLQFDEVTQTHAGKLSVEKGDNGWEVWGMDAQGKPNLHLAKYPLEQFADRADVEAAYRSMHPEYMPGTEWEGFALRGPRTDPENLLIKPHGYPKAEVRYDFDTNTFRTFIDDQQRPEPMQRLSDAEANMRGHGREAGAFMAGHFEPNTMVHLRYDVRDVEGKPALVLAEAQSDWHQKGDKHGYIRKADRERDTALKAEHDRLGERVKALDQEQEAAREAYRRQELDTKTYTDILKRHNEQVRALWDRMNEIRAERRTLPRPDYQAVPDAPMKGNAWLEMSLRRATRVAIDKGLDRLIWPATPEAVQATEHWRELTQKDGKFYYGSKDVTPIVRRYTDYLPRYAEKWAKKMGGTVNKVILDTESSTHTYQWHGEDPMPTRDTIRELEQHALRKVAGDRLARFTENPLTGYKIEGYGISAQSLLDDIAAYRNRLLNGGTDGEALAWGYNIKRMFRGKLEYLPERVPQQMWALNISPEMKHIAETQGFDKFASMGKKKTPLDQRVQVQPNTAARDVHLDRGIVLRRVSEMMERRFGVPWHKTEALFMAVQNEKAALDRLSHVFREAGAVVTDHNDVARVEEARASATDTRLGERQTRLYEPLEQGIARSTIKQRDLDNILNAVPGVRGSVVKDTTPAQNVLKLFLHARHAPERNAEVHRRNPGFQGSGSGMTDADAAAVMTTIQRMGRMGEMQRLAKMVDAIIADTNKSRVDYGLIDPNLLSHGPQFKHYVPLRGYAEESLWPDIHEDIAARAGKGRAGGVSVRGSEDPHIVGRDSFANDIVAHAILQNMETVVRGEKAKVGEALINLLHTNAKTHPDVVKQFATIHEAPKQDARYDPNTGTVKLVPVQTGENMIHAKLGGETYNVEVHDPHLLEALKGNLGTSSEFTRIARGLLHVWRGIQSRMATAWNPEFWFVNLPRDLETVLVNLLQYDIPGVGAKVVKALPRAGNAVMKAETGKGMADPRMVALYRQMQEDGGTTGLAGLRPLNEVLKAHTNRIKDAQNPMRLGAMGRKLRDTLDAYANVSENSTRLAVYAAMLDSGVSRARAAEAAKNMSVNFNTRGSARLLSDAYVFFNANVQGNVASARAILKSPKVRKIMGGLLLAGIAADQMNAAFSERDPDGRLKWDNVPDYRAQKFALFYMPGHKEPISIPLPLGILAAVYNTGRSLSAAMRHQQTGKDGMPWDKAGMSVLSGYTDAFNPFGASSNLLNLIMPSIFDIPVSLALNQKFNNSPVRPEQVPGHEKPESQNYWPSTNSTLSGITNSIHEKLGGSEYVPIVPWAENMLNPNNLAFVFNEVFSGVGRFASRTADAATKALNGQSKDIKISDVPVARVFVGADTERTQVERFFSAMKEIEGLRRQQEAYREQGNMEALNALTKRMPKQMGILNQMHDYQNRYAHIGRQMRELQKGKAPEDFKKSRLEYLDGQRKSIMAEANKLYFDTMGE